MPDAVFDLEKELLSKKGTILGVILRRAKRFPILPENEKIELAARYQKNNAPGVLQKLIDHDSSLIIAVVYRYKDNKVPLEDLYQEGVKGYIRACQKFDPSRGAKLSTYANLWIEQAIQRYIVATGGSVSMPVSMAWKIAKVRREWLRFNLTQRETVTPEYLASKTGLPLAEVEFIHVLLYQFSSCKSLDETVKVNAHEDSSSDSENSLVSYKSDESGKYNPETGSEKVQDKDQLNAWLELLPREQRSFIKQRYGLIDGEEKTHAQLGHLFGMCEEEAYQYEVSILELIRKIGEDEILKSGWADKAPLGTPIGTHMDSVLENGLSITLNGQEYGGTLKDPKRTGRKKKIYKTHSVKKTKGKKNDQ